MSPVLPSHRSMAWALPFVAVLLIALEARAGKQPPPDVALGRQIFEHNWARPESWEGTEVLGDGGDGLGPVFNAASCAECHALGGPGGAGRNTENAVLLSIAVEAPLSRKAQLQLLGQARKIHFAFDGSSSIVLHKFGFGPADDAYRFDEWRSELLSPAGNQATADQFVPVTFESGGVPLELAQRNTPALWGLATIELLRKHGGSDARARFGREQQRQSPWISGRIPRTDTGEEGWYGWRGQTQSLHDFVLNACAHELGLHVPGRAQPANPADPVRERTQVGKAKRLDLTEHQCRSLTEFIASLPRPQQWLPEGGEELALARAGELVFERIGCAACHPRALGEVTGLYSDLLLHDMGSSLSDRSSAQPEIEPGQTIRSGGGGYSGGGRVLARTPPRALPCDCEREWRTPPLWGVADSAPYLHDGRTDTLEDAILQHGGEAAPAAHAFRILSEDERVHVLSFLESLRAPQALALVP